MKSWYICKENNPRVATPLFVAMTRGEEDEKRLKKALLKSGLHAFGELSSIWWPAAVKKNISAIPQFQY